MHAVTRKMREPTCRGRPLTGTGGSGVARSRAGVRARVAMGAALLVVGGLAIGGFPLAAQEQPAPGTAATDRTPLPESAASERPAAAGAVATGDYLRMVVVLAAVLGAIYLLFRVIRRGAGGRLNGSERIDLLASRSLGGSRSLHLVRVGRQFLLVGAADQAVNLVARITDPESIDTLGASLAAGADRSRGRFADLLADAGIAAESRRATAAPDAAGGAGGDVRGAVRFLRRQRDRLRHLRQDAAPGEGVRAAR